ncbi:MAG: hypothetical protein VW268_04560 [Rhodospirillaceae bacterium]
MTRIAAISHPVAAADNTIGGGSDGNDTLIFRGPIELTNALAYGSSLFFFYSDDFGSTYYRTEIVNHTTNPLDFDEDNQGAETFVVANGLTAATGADTLVVGSDAAGPETLTGKTGNDLLLGNGGTFDFLGDENQAFTGTTSQVEARFNNNTKVLEIDTDSDGQKYMEIQMQNVESATLDETYFQTT